MTGPRLELSRAQILAFRRRVGALDQRLPSGPDALRQAAWAGLQDSVPRAALHSLHARVRGIGPTALDDPSLVQLWGPRFSAYVVADADRAIFTLGRCPDRGRKRQLAEELADRLETYLDGRRMSYGQAGHALGIHPNQLRYAAPTGRVLIDWDGARQPTVWTVAAPDMDVVEARLELARRYLHVFGPGTVAGFSDWAGIVPVRAQGAFHALAASLAPARAPIGDGWILASDEAVFRAPAAPAAPARLLPSGDAFFLLQGADRDLLVPDTTRRTSLWTPRVWPGALLVGGELAGTWRRSQADVSIHPWRRLSRGERDAVEAEAVSLPLPGVLGPARVRWEDSAE
ncbi:MAG TPA: crosslink repair DNA glycosylase YcaQ family protein [Candidatus Dormibacteraeota bacterium]|nr:crosslink repair DNA glycosylase YcaQ family protein [Candidatus Dormibacteraeota bacterium]